MYVRVCHAHANQTSVVRMALFVDSATRFGGVEADFFFCRPCMLMFSMDNKELTI